MQIYRIETTVQPDGVLTLRDLPFQAGEKVEVIIHPQSSVADIAFKKKIFRRKIFFLKAGRH